MARTVAIVLMLFGLSGVRFSEGCNIFGKQVSQADKDFIVNKHNTLRKLIANGQVAGQPRGINLKRLRWDNALAAAAQRIAETCTFAHVKVNDGRWQAVGQNLYISYSTAKDNGKPDWNGAIQAWFDEHKVYKYGTGFSKDSGHYTQVVWADTSFVGCGYTYFEAGGKYPYQKLYVCNYGPAGNYIGQYPYKTGKSGCENLC